MQIQVANLPVIFFPLYFAEMKQFIKKRKMLSTLVLKDLIDIVF